MTNGTYQKAKITIHIDKDVFADLAVKTHEMKVSLDSAIQKAIRNWIADPRAPELMQPNGQSEGAPAP